MGQYLERYLAGECQSVWAELLAQGAAIRQEPLASEAWAVAEETMRRVRHNIERLIPRLRTLGYRFGEIPRIPNRMSFQGMSVEFPETWGLHDFTEGFFQGMPVFQLPPPDTARVLDELEQRVGVVPVSLRAFYLEIGGVNLVGTHLTLDPNQIGYDPLFMYPLVDVEENPLDEAYDRDDLEELREGGEDGTIQLIFSPDVMHKYNHSGGGSYFMMMPNASIDGVFHDGFHEVTFVEYLRLCLRSGGLMDLEKAQNVEVVAEALAYLRQDLLPI